MAMGLSPLEGPDHLLTLWRASRLHQEQVHDFNENPAQNRDVRET